MYASFADIIPFPNVSYQQAPTREVVSIEPLLYTVNSGSEYRIEPLDASDFYSSIYEADERNVQLEDYDMNSDEEEMCSPLIEYELATEVYQNVRFCIHYCSAGTCTIRITTTKIA